jgi:hypothetical protein
MKTTEFRGRLDPLALVRISEVARLRRVAPKRIRTAISEQQAIRIGAWAPLRVRDVDDCLDRQKLDDKARRSEPATGQVPW